MYSLMLKKKFIAQHFLIGQDFGPENELHSHQYHFELELEKSELDACNFLIDIVAVKEQIDKLISYFEDKVLNELPEFKDENPSLELFSKILWQKFDHYSTLPLNTHITVRLWEDDIAQASYRELK